MSFPTDLSDQNPWWRNKDAIIKDAHISAWNKSAVQWDPRITHTFDFGTDAIYTIRGPRQVGKTTLTKLLIMQLLERVDSRRILYYTCDLISEPRELAGKISQYIDWLRSFSEERAYIFLDEISTIRNWQSAIKYLADTGKLGSVTMILTGSHTLDIKQSSERLPGRRGIAKDSLDKTFLPMSFSEYVNTLSKDIAQELGSLGLNSFEKKSSIIKNLFAGIMPDELNRLLILIKDLNDYLRNYFVTGGMPKVVDEYKKSGGISESTYTTYVDVVRGDLARWGKQERYLRQVIGKIVDAMVTPVGWNTLKQGTDIASHNTIADYIDALEQSFILLYLHNFDMAKKAPSYQKNKKIYFRDPFFFHALRNWISGRDPFEESLDFLKNSENAGKMAECVAADHLVRFAFQVSKVKQLFEYENNVLYWKGKKGREVDFVLRMGDRYLPIEVKFQSALKKSDLYGIIDFSKSMPGQRGIILSKDVLESKNKIIVVPIALFLLLV